MAEFGLGEFLDALLVDAKPRLLLRFRTPTDFPSNGFGDVVVLKVYGDGPRGEGPLLAAWRDHAIPVPRVRFGERAGCSWLLLDYLRLSPVAPRSYDEHLDLTVELAGYGPVLHRPAPQLARVLRRLDVVMQPRWDTAADVLRTAGHEVPIGWRARALTAYRGGHPRPLHGDLGLPNIGRDPAGSLVIYDASALLGDCAFDAARWSARNASRSVAPEELLITWLEVEGLRNSTTARDLLAVECVLEAGAREIVASRRATRMPSDDEGVTHLLAVAHLLLD